MRILILGLSKIFKNRILPALEKCNYITIIDCASLTQNENDFISNKKGDFYYNYDEALRKSQAKFVYISVRNSDHSRLILKSINNDKHVFVDKPAVLNRKDALDVYNLAKEKNKCISEAIVYSYHSQISYIKNAFLTNNSQPIHIDVNFTIPGFDAQNFRYDMKFGGGAIFDLGPYAMSLGEIIFESKISDCFGFYKISNEIPTAFNLTLRYENKQTLNGYFGFETEYLNSATIFSKDMNIYIDRLFTLPADYKNVLHIRNKDKISEISIDSSDMFFNYFNEVIFNIINNKYSIYNEQLIENYNKIELLTTSLKH